MRWKEGVGGRIVVGFGLLVSVLVVLEVREWPDRLGLPIENLDKKD